MSAVVPTSTARTHSRASSEDATAREGRDERRAVRVRRRRGRGASARRELAANIVRERTRVKGDVGEEHDHAGRAARARQPVRAGRDGGVGGAGVR